jgi:hypothetical protein
MGLPWGTSLAEAMAPKATVPEEGISIDVASPPALGVLMLLPEPL